MTPAKQRIAIAEACGWKFHTTPAGGVSINNWKTPRCGYTANCPDYLNDLNAMHEAEKVLDLQAAGAYAEHLGFVVEQRSDIPWVVAGSYAHVSATAAQRAEGFLRTVGKWEDS